VAGVVGALSAGPAAADSLTYIKGNNVWLANPDGSGQYQVTFDGTQSAPYESPSQADNGTVVAIRETPGQRRQIYRMTQSGALLNAPVSTPAPGTGAINAKVSPNGALVAYWFVTLVNDPLCTFCVNVSNRALLSRSDSFTRHDELGTPNTGGYPSWLSNDTITLGSGSATQWYYRLGMPEAAEWFVDNDIVPGSIVTLLDAEAAPAGDRLAVVRGDNQETIAVLKMNGPPPAKPSVANGQCGSLTGPTGKFADPTWSSDGRLLAWQEGDGVWTGVIPADLANCAGFGPFALRIPGASAPDLSPAPLNPGVRPPCGNPGNPTACGKPCAVNCKQPDPQVDTAAVRRSLKRLARKLGTKVRVLLRRGRVSVGFTAPSAGALSARLTATGASARGATLIAAGRHSYTAAGKAKLVLRLTRQGRKRVRSSHRLKAALKVSFTPTGAKAISTTSRVRVRR
jgi:hypothetical protein